MAEQQPKPKKEKNNNDDSLRAYSRYSTIALQMVVIIIATSLGGVQLDKIIGTEHLFTILLSLLGVASAMWLIIKEALRKP